MSDTILAAIISAVSGIITALAGIIIAVINNRAKTRDAQTPSGAADPFRPPQPAPASPAYPPLSPSQRRRPFWLIAIGTILVGAAILITVLYMAGLIGRTPLDAPENFLDRIRHSVKPHTARSAKRVDTLASGKDRYNYYLWIEAPAEVMSQIDKVIYDFADRNWFNPPQFESVDRAAQFRTYYVGVGAWARDMDIILVLHDGQRVTLKFNMYDTWIEAGRPEIP